MTGLYITSQFPFLLTEAAGLRHSQKRGVILGVAARIEERVPKPDVGLQ